MKACLIATLVLCLVFPSAANAQAFKLFPGAKLNATMSAQATDEAVTMAHGATGIRIDIYETSASVEKVVAFYQPLYKEDKSSEPPAPGELRIQIGFFVLDGASSVLTSKFWLAITPGPNGALTYIKVTKGVGMPVP
jgi:hypothetical protein